MKAAVAAVPCSSQSLIVPAAVSGNHSPLFVVEIIFRLDNNYVFTREPCLSSRVGIEKSRFVSNKRFGATAMYRVDEWELKRCDRCICDRHYSVNAGLTPVCSLHGVAVTTIEALGSTKTKLHQIQVYNVDVNGFVVVVVWKHNLVKYSKINLFSDENLK